MITATKTFSFEVAHHFPLMPEGTKHNRIHGHSYYCDLTVYNNKLNKFGFVCDFDALERACDDIKEMLDHKFINDVVGENPSMENIGNFIIQQFQEGQKSDRINYSFLNEVRLTSIKIYRPSVGQSIEICI